MGTDLFNTSRIYHYANHRSVNGFLLSPTSVEEIAEGVRHAISKGLRVCPMGTQNSFSDIFLGEDQLHISMLQMNRIISCDFEKQEITLEPGVRISDVWKCILPAGFYLTGVSGSYTDTIGGLISSNSHGKDSWKHGNFGANVASLKLLTASGEILSINKHNELINAVIGGLGGLGIVVEITLALKPLPSYFIAADNKKIPLASLNYDTALNSEFRYAWMDLVNAGNPNAILRTASFAAGPPERLRKEEVPSQQNSIYGLRPRNFWKIIAMFWNPSTYWACNWLIDFVQRDKGKTETKTLIDYTYPWRKYPGNKFVFKGDAFYELHCFFPAENFQTALEQITKLIMEYKILPIATSLKWHKPEPFYLSFSGKGLSILNTFEAQPVKTKKGQELFEKYLQIVFDMRGKVYLSKYGYFNRQQITAMYPEFNKWMDLKRMVDPQNVFLSDRLKQITT